jgi:patatin-like phospholipase/acyl hydrolase
MHALSLNGHIPTTFSTLNARANPEEDFYLKDALGASMSAIPMFSPKIIDGKPYIDGGAFANNPVLAGFAELKSHYPEITPEDVIMVSLGTGHYNIPYNASVGHGLFQWILKNDQLYILNYMPALAIQKAASILFPHYHRLEDFVPVELWDIGDPANIEPLQKLAE